MHVIVGLDSLALSQERDKELWVSAHYGRVWRTPPLEFKQSLRYFFLYNALLPVNRDIIDWIYLSGQSNKHYVTMFK